MSNFDDGHHGPYHLTSEGKITDKETQDVNASTVPADRYLLPLKVMHKLMLLEATLACAGGLTKGNKWLDDSRATVRELIRDNGGNQK